MNLGWIQHNINASEQYEILAKEDEASAKVLLSNGKFRNAIYFYIQSMEKYVRSHIFAIINPQLKTFREMNQHHSLEESVELLLNILITDKVVLEQVRDQFYNNVLDNIRFSKLHNNLRYPFYNMKNKSFSNVEFSENDCKIIEGKVQTLKKFLSQLYKLK